MLNFAGYREVELTDPEMGLTFPLLVFYPTQTPAADAAVGPYRLLVAPGAPPAPGRFPLVLISHGRGSSPYVYRTLAHYLARHGFVVGLPQHPGNNRHDNTWEGTVQNLLARPRHLQLAVQCLMASPAFAGALQPEAVAVIGHSMGGYTALALAGGVPTPLPAEVPGGRPQPLAVAQESRVKALVLLAPATVWFRVPGALANVCAPILLVTAANDAFTPSFHAEIVLAGVPSRAQVAMQTVAGAGHYSFLSPFPAALTKPEFPPSQDPPGFDREAFHERLFPEVAAFLAGALRA